MKDKLTKNIETEESILSSIKKGNNLLVPDNYFEQLPKQLLELSDTKNSKPTKTIVRFIYTSVAIAAAIILGFFVLKPSNELSTEVALYNNTFKNLTAEGFSEELLLEEDYLIAEVKFDDAEVLHFLKVEMQKPHLEIKVTVSDFENYFEEEENY